MYLTVCLVFSFLFVCPSICETQVEVQNYLKALRKELFRNRNYDRMARPVMNHTETVQTTIKLYLINIKALDIQTHVLESTVGIEIFWTDPFLSWKPDEFDGIELIHIDMNEVYRPDVTLANSVDGANLIRSSTYSNLLLYNEGALYWMPIIPSKTLCTIDLTEWPFDRQTCSFKFVPWVTYASAVNLSTNSIDGINLISQEPNPEWKIIETYSKMQYKSYSCCPEVYPEVIFYLTIERTASLYRFTIYWPLIAALLINLMSLLVDIRDNVRFQANWVSLVLLVLLVLYLGFKLGFGTAGTPKVIIYLGQMIILVACTIVWFFIGRILAKSTVKVPASVTRALKPIYKFKRNDIESVQLEVSPSEMENIDGERIEIVKEAQINSSIDNLVIIYVIDRLLFLISLFLMIVLHN